ncbi:flavin reductase like domain-containing protein [Crucibulum laeve]|uniref:Flavin reductase like domain-containing protein n=1 Tax=Crucibulum laeve TaxID=68775 RepID=A0A5C3M2W7_9AGAR|nr:flavin reductase like domain-containing protein [Crucibulum laeve]
MSRTTRTLGRNLRHVAQHSSYSTQQTSGSHVRDQLRCLLRETAQPVAVVTSFMPDSNKNAFHGATLSSFTSIAMDPYPLVTFALRIPSRMATSLSTSKPDEHSHMVVNVLSADQAEVAVKFSRPDLHREPFTNIPFSLTDEGLPVIGGSLGALSCKLVSKAIPLHDLDFLENGAWKGRGSLSPPALDEGVASELFIARVMRVEMLSVQEADQESPRTLPLLYHRRGFTRCVGIQPLKERN